MPSDWVNRWGYVSADAPADRCGVTVKFPQTDPGGPISDVTCWRETWDEFDQCIWHADTDEKPREELIDSRTENPERLDGAILRNQNLGSSISFSNCEINGGDFTGANLSMADMTDTTLRYADLSDSMLFRTSLSGANLRESDVQNSDLNEADLSESALVQVNISNTVATQANFTDSLLAGFVAKNADLRGCSVADCHLRNSNFTGSNLHEVDAKGADFIDANLTDASAREADFASSSLENAILTRTDLRGANLENTDLFQVQLSDIRLNSSTNFGDLCSYEASARSPRVAANTQALEAAAWVYRRLEILHEDNALAKKSRKYHIRKQEAQRARDKMNKNYDRYAVATLNKLLTNYGESLKRLVIGWAITILGFGLLYPIVGGVSDYGTVYKIDLSSGLPTRVDLISAGESLLRGLYFSTITFTTIGYANVAPNGLGPRILVGIESLFGAILIALFVYVLGRRTAR